MIHKRKGWRFCAKRRWCFLFVLVHIVMEAIVQSAADVYNRELSFYKESGFINSGYLRIF